MVLDGSFHTKIVGVTFKNEDGSDRQRIIRDLIRNEELEEGTELFFVPQPTNPYDSNCILIKAANGKTLGSLSKELAATISPQIQQGYTFKVYVSSYTGGDIGYAYGVNIKVERYKPSLVSNKTATPDESELNLKEGQVITFGRFYQGTERDDYKHQRKFATDELIQCAQDPIEWFVLCVQNEKALLFSKKILEADVFGETSDWKQSVVRKWLNEDFYKIAFSDAEKKRIIKSILTDVGVSSEATGDRIFLLSVDEAERYINQKGLSVENKASYYADHTVYGYLVNGFAKWWLRTPGSQTQMVACASWGYNGVSMDYDGMYCKTMGEHTEDEHHSSARIGIRPAMWINLGEVDSVKETEKPESKGTIKCEVCGSNNIIKQDGSFMCQSCGIRYSLDEIKKMLQNGLQSSDEDDEEDEENEDFEDRGVTLQEGDLVFFGEYPFKADDNTKYSIDWIVAEAKDGKFLLLSKYMIDFVQYNTYNEPRTDIPPILDSRGRYQYVWHNSSLREWLNSDFIEEAFDEDEQDALQTRDISFPENTYEEDTEYGPMKLTAEPLPNCQDKVFLPSEIEAEIPYRLYIGPEWEAKTPYAKNKAQDRKYEYCRQFWNLTQPFSTDYNTANLSGMGSLGSYISGCPGTEYAFLRPMVLVDQDFIYDAINDYTDEYFEYYLECLNKHRESNQKEKERREKARQEYLEQQAAKKAEEERKKEEDRRKAEEAAQAKKSNPPLTEDDSYYDDQGLGFYNGTYYTEESWRETHMNPWGTEDVGDGYIDSDGVFTEY